MAAVKTKKIILNRRPKFKLKKELIGEKILRQHAKEAGLLIDDSKTFAGPLWPDFTVVSATD